LFLFTIEHLCSVPNTFFETTVFEINFETTVKYSRENSPHIFRGKISVETSVFETSVFEANSRYQKYYPFFLQDNEDENDEEDDDDDDDDDALGSNEEDEGAEEEPLGSGDDISDEDPSDLFNTENVSSQFLIHSHTFFAFC